MNNQELEERLTKLVSKRLKIQRTKLELTKSQLAKQIGMSAVHYAHYESGRRLPRLSTLLRLIKALDCDPGYLMGLKTKGK